MIYQIRLTTILNGRKDASVLLQTAKTVMCNRDNGKQLAARILQDNGSLRSYTSQEVCKTLGLKYFGKHCLNLNTFGCSKIARQYCGVVSLHLETCSGELRIHIR